MESTTRRVLTACAVFSLILGIFSPTAGEAATKKVAKKPVSKARIAMNLYIPNKVYGDEKKEIKDPTSRCLTATAKAARAKDLKVLEEDKKKLEGVDGDDAHPLTDDYKKYETALEYAWGAMEEPYCGFGAFGSSAALKSYQKTVLRARTAFLDALKKKS